MNANRRWAPDHWEYTLGVDDRNQLTLIKELDIDAGTTTRSDTPVYDAAGSLVFDGNYYFQYDAWNRLVQVNEATDMGGAGIVRGDLVKRYLYDGLGRLVRTQSPAGGGSSVRTERFYYDGLRRIQEFVTEPLTPLVGIDGDPTLPSTVAGAHLRGRRGRWRRASRPDGGGRGSSASRGGVWDRTLG